MQKVLVASWTWYPVGGDWTYVENVTKLYEANGYEVIPFSTQNEKNFPSEYEKYFVTGYDYKQLNAKKNIKNSFNALKNSVVSFDALRKIDDLLENNEISFAHLHIIHHWLTPAIIWKLKKRGIPIIWSLHEYKLICPEGSFVSNSAVCEKCFDNKFYNCAMHKCKKQSFLASILASFDAYFYHFSGVYKKVDSFLCPSQFLLDKFKQFGFDGERLKLTNYCYDIAFLDSSIKAIKETNGVEMKKQAEKYILYVGRIERIKGIATLIDAVAGTEVILKIAGTGAALPEMQEYVKQKGLTNIEFLGFAAKQLVYELTINALSVICPSEWYENYPFSVIESLLMSTPVIGSQIGGIPELVIDGVTGLVFEPGNSADLRSKILLLWNDELYAKRLGNNARTFAEGKVNFETHWNILQSIISKLEIKNAVTASSAVLV